MMIVIWYLKVFFILPGIFSAVASENQTFFFPA